MIKKLLLGLALLAVPACVTPAKAFNIDKSAQFTGCLDPVLNEVIFDTGMELIYTFTEEETQRIKRQVGTNQNIKWTDIDVYWKPEAGYDENQSKVLFVFNGVLPNSKQKCIFDYGDMATRADLNRIINALSEEQDD